MTLESLLLERGVVTDADIRRATAQAASTETSVRDVLIRDGLVTDEQIGWHLADAHGLPFVHLTAEMIDADLVRRAGSALLQERCAIPMQALWGEVTLAVANPDQGDTLEALQEALGTDLEMHIAVAQESKIRYLLNEVFGGDYDEGESGTQHHLADPAGVATLFGHLVRAVSHDASLVRFDTTSDGLVVRAEVEGRVRTVDRLRRGNGHAVAARARLLLDGASSGTVRTVLFGAETRLAIDVIPTRLADAVVIRIERPGHHDRRPLAVQIGGEDADAARELVLGGPIVLVAGPDERARSSLARALVAVCLTAGAPVAAVTRAGVELPGDCTGIDIAHLDGVAALRPRVLLIDVDVDPARVRELAEVVPSIVLVRPVVSAAAALALCPIEIQPLARAAVGPDGPVEAVRWS